MNKRQSQSGATLIVSMIMLIVVTLLVVYSIRSGNTNLRIAGNMQRQSEALIASQQAIEQVIGQIKASNNINLIPAQNITVSSSGASYTVSTNSLGAPGACILQVPVQTSSLDPSKAADIPCFQSVDVDKPITSTGTAASTLSACNDQSWEIVATINDASSGTQLTQVQGINIRTPATVACP